MDMRNALKRALISSLGAAIGMGFIYSVGCFNQKITTFDILVRMVGWVTGIFMYHIFLGKGDN